ncbi:MAG: hypothetical protein EBX41_07115, partial [Chitinophagia bacterium]|nr:hypothetical protein [Chitinophagia bacterium]
CTEVHVTIEDGNIVTVVDNGRGIPIDMHKEKKICLRFCKVKGLQQ